MQHTICIGNDGTITMLYNDELRSLLQQGDATVGRASHVEPDLNGGWFADMSPVGGPVLRAENDKGFETRAEALAAEVQWLEVNILAKGLKTHAAATELRVPSGGCGSPS